MLRLTKSAEYSGFELADSSPAIEYLDLSEIISAAEATIIAVVSVKVAAAITIEQLSGSSPE